VQYTPSFVEAFVGLMIAVGWGAWLESRGFAAIRWAVAVAGLLVIAGQLVAMSLVATGDPAVLTDPRLTAARWLPFAAVVGTIGIEAALTVVARRKGR
jgi:hypothetical protein